MEVVIAGRAFKVKLVQGRGRRAVSARFITDGLLELTLPKGFAQLSGFLEKHKAWLERAYKRHKKRLPVFRGNEVMFKGAYYRVNFIEYEKEDVHIVGSLLNVYVRGMLDIKDAIMRWLETETREYLASKGDVFREFGIKDVTVRYTKNRWGLCKRSKQLVFNSVLACLPEHLREYLIYHEIAHTFEMNHSRRYKAWLEKFVPDFREREREFRKYTIV